MIDKINGMSKIIDSIEVEVIKNPVVNQSTRSQIEKINKDLGSSLTKLNNEIKKYEKNSKKAERLRGLKEAKTKLDGLVHRVETIRGNLPSVFEAKETRSISKRMMNCAVNMLIKPVTRQINLVMFIGAKEKITNVKLQEKLEKLKQIEDKIQAKINNEVGINSKEMKELQTKSDKIKEKIRILSEKVEKIKSYYEKGNKLRKNFVELGAERVTLKTADKVNLDGLFCDAKKFRKKLADAGCKQVVLKSNEGSSLKEVNAIYLSKQDYDFKGKDVIETLEKVGAFADTSTKQDSSLGVGWQVVYQGEDVLLVQNRELPPVKYDKDKGYHFADHPFFSFNTEKKRWETKPDAVAPLKLENIDTTKPASGTVILSSGSRGIYEQNKKETTFFLLRNMNVMVFNFRGYGGSEGDPTRDALNLDMEAAYQFVKARTEHADKKIVFKALCLSAPTAAYVASKHPETNLILDQTFSSLKSLIKDFSTEKVNEIIKKHQTHLEKKSGKKSRLARIVGYIVSKFAPSLSTSKSLGKNRGKKAIFYSSDDEIVSLRNVEKNIQAISRAGRLKDLTLISGPGEHAIAITGIKASPEMFSQQALRKRGDKYRILEDTKKVYEKEIKESSNKLETLDADIQKIEAKIAKNTLELDSLDSDQKVNTPRIVEMFSKKIEERTLILGKLKDKQYVELLKKEEFEKKLQNTTLDINKLIISMDDLYGELKVAPTGQIQLEHFLNKAGLMEQVIPVPAQRSIQDPK